MTHVLGSYGPGALHPWCLPGPYLVGLDPCKNESMRCMWDPLPQLSSLSTLGTHQGHPKIMIGYGDKSLGKATGICLVPEVREDNS